MIRHHRKHSVTTNDDLDDVAEGRAPPRPGAVRDNVGRVGDHRSVVCVELTRLVRRTIVVRVADRRQRTVEHALRTNVHVERSRHLVDHPLSRMMRPLPTCVKTCQRRSGLHSQKK